MVRNLHIFDFDGTLFRSPCPHKERINAKFGPNAYDEVVAPRSSNGYGWFESPRTLSVPVIPPLEYLAAEAETHLPHDVHDLYDKDGVKCRSMFIEPNVAKFVALKEQHTSVMQQQQNAPASTMQNNNNNVDPTPSSSSLHHHHHHSGSSTSSAYHIPRLFVMSGRHESLRSHIAAILSAKKLLPPGGLILKESQNLGTVKYKIHAMFKMYVDALFDFSRARMLPISTTDTGSVHITYYEDRQDQGNRIGASMTFLRWLLQPHIGSKVLTMSADYKNGLRMGKGSLDVTSAEALKGAGCPEDVLEVLQLHHLASYAEHVSKKLGKLFHVRSRNQNQQHSSSSSSYPNPAFAAVQSIDAVAQFLRILPTIVFHLEMVPAEWGPETFLSAEAEDRLLEEMEKDVFA